MTCTPPPAPACCNSCGTCAGKRKRRHMMLSNATYVADYETFHRVKRQDDADTSPSSSDKCNSEELRKIIENKIDRVTAIAKRRIQEEAESTMGGRFNVICARGDFSYVANTELFCQHSVGDVTCFLFKQLSDVAISIKPNKFYLYEPDSYKALNYDGSHLSSTAYGFIAPFYRETIEQVKKLYP